MAIQTTYTNIRTDLPHLWDEVTRNHEIVIISKHGSENVALISASELASLAETVHLLKSSKNAERLLTALYRAQDRTIPSQTLEELRQEVGLEQNPFASLHIALQSAEELDPAPQRRLDLARVVRGAAHHGNH